MKRLKRCVGMIGLAMLLPGAGGPAQAQGPQEGWQVYANANYVNDLALEGGGALGGGYTWAATTGGVVCFSAGQQAEFTTADGLADNYVRAITMDGGGRLWFGTWDGGVSVLDYGGTPFDKDDDTWATFTTAHGLADNDVYVIAVDGGRRLWFGTYGGGVSVLDHGGTPFDKGDDTWATFTTADGLAGNSVYAITVDGGSRLWFGTEVGGASVLEHGGTPFDKGDDTWTTFTTADGLADNLVWAIAVDGGRRLWFGTESGVSVLENRGTPFYKGDDIWTTFTTADGLASSLVWAIAVDGGSRMWFGTEGGVSVLDHNGTPFGKQDDTWTTFSTADGLADNDVRAIAVDGGNRVWLGTWGGGVSVLDYGDTPFDKGDDTWATFTAADGLADNGVRAIVVDDRNRLWFGTYGGGVSVLDHGGTPFDKGDDIWTTFTHPDGLADNYIRSIALDSGELLWLGTRGGGVSVLDNRDTPFYKGDDTWTTFTHPDGLADNGVTAIAVDSGGRLWFGTWGGVSVLDHSGSPFDKGDDIWTTFTTADGLANLSVRAITVDGENRTWFGTEGGGASVLDHRGTPFYKGDDTWTSFTTADGLAYNDVRAITVGSGNRTWFGTWGGGVSVLDHGGTPFYKGDDSWTTFSTANGLASNRVYAIAMDGGSRLWFSTEGGVSVLEHGGTPFDKGDDTWTTFTELDGLADDYVNAIAADVGGRLWFGTWDGVSELVDAVAPASSAYNPTYANCKVSAPWSASDGASHIFRVTLWVKHGGGSWTNTALSQGGQSSGAFAYTPTYGDGTYYFATVAEDWMGNMEASPTEYGDCSTYVERCAVYLPLTLKDHVAYFEGPWESEDNDSYTAANGPLRSGRGYYGYPDDAKDYFSIYLRTDGDITIDLLNHTGQGVQLQLFYQTVDNRVAWVTSQPYHIEYTAAAGWYYVYIYTASSYSSTDPYTLRVTY